MNYNDDNENENDGDMTSLRQPLLDKRMANHYSDPSDQRHHFDICFVSFDLKDLGHHFYPRYIETANCRNHMPATLKDRLNCVPIHYNVQVLTHRKDTDPEDGPRGNGLPESLKDWRFVHIPVNVGCHCTVLGSASVK